MELPRSTAIAVLTMRLTLGLFLLQWSIEKLVSPSVTVRITANFYGIAIPEYTVPLMGVAELLISTALLLGFARRPVYGLATIIHAISTIATWRQLLDPFGFGKVGNHLFIAGVPVLGAFLALYLLRELDINSADEWLVARRHSLIQGR